MFGYAEQRELFKLAKEHGWEGKEPSVLGTYCADKNMKEVAEFLADTQPSKLHHDLLRYIECKR